MRSAAAPRRAGRGRRDRHQHGLPGAEGPQDGRRRGAARRPRPRGGARPCRRRGRRRGASRLPVTVKLRSGLRPGERSGFELAHRLVAEAGVAAIGFHPRSAAVQHKGAPDYELAARLVAHAAGARDPDRRPRTTPTHVARGLRADRRRRRDARARRARQPVAVRRAARASATGRPSREEVLDRARLDDRAGRRAPRRADARPATCASSTRGTWHGSGSSRRTPGRSASRCSAATRWRASGRCSAAREPLGTPPEGVSDELSGVRRRPGLAILLRSPEPSAPRHPRSQRGFAVSPTEPRTRDRGSHAEGRHPHPRRPQEAQGRARAAVHREAPRGRRAHQGGARVRRHLRELRVRRRQERAGDGREPDRPAAGEAAHGDGDPGQGPLHRRRPGRLGRARQGRKDRQVGQVHDRRLGRGQARGDTSSPTSRPSAARCSGASATRPSPSRSRAGPRAS